jgi:photosystem II stability/assembly factor-like uncharacterized protein
MSLTHRLVVAAGAGLALLLSIGAGATVQFPALDREAARVRAPERTVLLATTLAGSRTVAVGERGVVVLSDDGGAHWRQAKAVPVAVTLTAVQFVDARRGWAVGHGGVILGSEDGGETWTRQADGRTLAAAALAAAKARSAARAGDADAVRQLKAAQMLVEDGPDKPLFDVRFSDAKHGWVIGAYSLFFETHDGGATWVSRMDRLDNPKGAHLYAMGMRGDAIFIAGEQGVLFRSQDAGTSFQSLPSPYKGSWFSLVTLPDGGLVVAGLRGTAMYSNDQGESWSRIDGAPPVSFIHGIALPDGSALLGNQAGQLLQTRSGASFKPLAVPSLPPLSDLVTLPGGGLLVVGFAGAIQLPSSSR